jgi:NAD(P)-dependent dehydrogenase (short-subunit alcohol dehydrogenase family)
MCISLEHDEKRTEGLTVSVRFGSKGAFRDRPKSAQCSPSGLGKAVAAIQSALFEHCALRRHDALSLLARAQGLWRTPAPMRRAASPEDIAKAVVMLIESDYLTGKILLSDGGLDLT